MLNPGSKGSARASWPALGALAALAAAGCDVTVLVDRGPGRRLEPAARAAAPPDFGTVLVRPIASGDTVSEIAHSLHLPAGVIVALNDLRDPDLIREGAGLKVPAHPPWTDGLQPYRRLERIDEALVPCAAVEWEAPELATRAGCERAACASAPRAPGAKDRGFRVCSCVGREGTEGEIALLRGKERRATWKASFWLDDPARFAVRLADLDGDGAPEIVVASLTFGGRGIGDSTWEMAVLDGAALARPGAPGGEKLVRPLLVEVCEHGRGSLLERADGEAGAACDVFATTWTWAHDPLHGTGSYFMGRRYLYGDGALRAAGPTALMNRFDRDFPWEAEGRPDAPASFFEGAKAWPEEMLRDDPLVETAAGIIERVRVDSAAGAGTALTFRVAWDLGGTGLVGWPVFLPDGDGAAGAGGDTPDAPATPDRAYDELGDLTAGALLPPGYVPADPRALEGRRIVVERRRDREGIDQVIAWLDGPRYRSCLDDLGGP